VRITARQKNGWPLAADLKHVCTLRRRAEALERQLRAADSLESIKRELEPLFKDASDDSVYLVLIETSPWGVYKPKRDDKRTTMTASELVETIKQRGGVLALDGDGVEYVLPSIRLIDWACSGSTRKS
jgi:hypothetical protein